MAKTLAPVHPGEILLEEFLKPLKISSGKLAATCHVPRTRIERLVKEETGITADTALRLAKALNTTAQFWLNLQNGYDMRTTQPAIEGDLKFIEPINELDHAA